MFRVYDGVGESRLAEMGTMIVHRGGVKNKMGCEVVQYLRREGGARRVEDAGIDTVDGGDDGYRRVEEEAKSGSRAFKPWSFPA